MKKILVTLFFASIFNSYSQQYSTDSVSQKLSTYKSVRLSTDLSQINDMEKEGLKFLVRAAEMINEIFKLQAYAGHPITDTITNAVVKKYMEINYGPWDRLSDNKPFINGIGPKPLGANYYPADMRQTEFDSLSDERKNSPYSIIVREEGQLVVKPYNEVYSDYLAQASMFLRTSAGMLNDPQLLPYLLARADALISNQYDESDKIWLQMKGNKYDIIIGPIENYEDQLYGLKTSYEAYVLVKDIEWSKRLEKYVAYLPELQKNLPVEKQYKAETTGGNSQINAYDAIYYGGDCNSGSKTIAVNLPNDEQLQINYGTRRSQIKNVMKAKFDHIMMPITKALMDSSQIKHVNFNAFFANTMFHEVAHGLGIKNTINGKGTVREALGANYNALEEGKADILGLYMITELFNKKVLTEGQLMDYYVTFMAGIFRSVRFGAASAHGKANMIRFNYFQEKGAFTKDPKTQKYKIDMAKMKLAMTELSALILKLQGDGDVEGVKKLLLEKGQIPADLQNDLNKLLQLKIPVDIIFEQGEELIDSSKK
jgi:hypothetical protein